MAIHGASGCGGEGRGRAGRLLSAGLVAVGGLAVAARPVAGEPYLGRFDPLQPGTGRVWRLQDFCIFGHEGWVYAAAMNKADANRMVLGRTRDYATWEYLGEALGPPRGADEDGMIWAPHVIEDRGAFHMFYTGVVVPSAGQWNQRICVATSFTPELADSWQRNREVRFVVDGRARAWFKPSHPGAVWNPDGWADCRDPMVLEHAGVWYMFYSGADTTGGICGVATAPDPLGPWVDAGAVLRVGEGIPESCFVVPAPDGSWIMTLNHASTNPQVRGIKSARGMSLVPVNGEPPFGDLRLLNDTLPGWAHEFLPGGEPGRFLCAHLTGYWVNLRWAYSDRRGFGWTLVGADAPEDNCPRAVNPQQHDRDGDGVGDACDLCPTAAAATTCGCP